VKNLLKILVVWLTLLAVPLQGFAFATMPLCAPISAAAEDHDHDHESMVDDVSDVHAHDDQEAADMQSDHQHPAAHHHKAKCAACATCGSCVPMAPSFTSVVPPSASLSLTVALDQRILTSVDLALPERPPRA
jgi:hypothetical protein